MTQGQGHSRLGCGPTRKSSSGASFCEEGKAMFTAVVGHSEDLDAGVAAEEVLAQCREKLKGTTPTAGLLFAAIDFDHQVLLNEIKRSLRSSDSVRIPRR
jgi:hypothetical protein